MQGWGLCSHSQLNMNYFTIIQGLKPLLHMGANVSFPRRGKPVVIRRGMFKQCQSGPVIFIGPRIRASTINLNPPEVALALNPTFTSLPAVWAGPEMNSCISPIHVILPCNSAKESFWSWKIQLNQQCPPKTLREATSEVCSCMCVQQ